MRIRRMPHPGRRAEHGMTLAELLVSIAVLAIVMVSLLAGFQIGIRTVGSGGVQDRAAGAHDISSLEQQLGQDGARAGCVSVGAKAYGACSKSVAPSGTVISACTGSGAFCFAWMDWQSSPATCRIAAYAQPSGATRVVRTEYVVSATGGTIQLGASNVTTSDGVSLTVTPATTTAASGSTWISSLTVAITTLGVTRGTPPSGSVVLRPLTSDPGGQAETVQC